MTATMTQSECELAVVLLNENGSILDAQPACTATLGWTRDELIGKDVGELLSSGRDVLLSQLPQYDEAVDSNENTSISVRVLARRKDKSEFAARVTIRRFPELGCWTLAFYSHPSDLESNAPPTVTAEEIALATKRTPPAAPPPARSHFPFWQNSRLLFSSRKKTEPRAPKQDDKPPVISRAEPVAPPLAPPVVSHDVEAPPETKSASDFQRQLDVTASTLARLKGDIERERGERSRAEQRAASLATQVKALHVQLSESLTFEGDNQKRIASAEAEARQSREALARCKAELENESAERKAAEDQVKILRELNGQLEASRTLFEETKKSFERKQTEFEARLQKFSETIKSTEAALEEEMKARQEADRKLTAAAREYRESLRANDSKIDQLESTAAAHELRCKSLEEEVLRVRSEAIESSRLERTTARELRSKLEAPARRLNHLTCQLLQADANDEQKAILESLLQDILALETALHESPSSSQEAEPVQPSQVS